MDITKMDAGGFIRLQKPAFFNLSSIHSAPIRVLGYN